MMKQKAAQNEKTRLYGYDLARCVAFIGMVIVNFKIVMVNPPRGSYWLVSLTDHLDGKAAATFVVLAGVGLSLRAQQPSTPVNSSHKTNVRKILVKRALFLFVLGLLYVPIWEGDILHFYGVYLAIGAATLTKGPRELLALAAASVASFVLFFMVFDYDAGWNWSTISYKGFWSAKGFVRNLVFNGFHPVIPWISFLFLGMSLGQQELRDTSIRRRLLVWSSVIAISVESTSWYLIKYFSTRSTMIDAETVKALIGTDPMPPMPLYMVAAGSVAVAVICLCVMVTERFSKAIWLKPLVATGQMTLTLYVAHVIIGMGILTALGRLENQPLIFSVTMAGIFCIFAIAFACAWRKKFHKGPLESVMRTITG